MESASQNPFVLAEANLVYHKSARVDTEARNVLYNFIAEQTASLLQLDLVTRVERENAALEKSLVPPTASQVYISRGSKRLCLLVTYILILYFLCLSSHQARELALISQLTALTKQVAELSSIHLH